MKKVLTSFHHLYIVGNARIKYEVSKTIDDNIYKVSIFNIKKSKEKLIGIKLMSENKFSTFFDDENKKD